MPNVPNVDVIQREEIPAEKVKRDEEVPKKAKYDEAITAFNNATAKALDTFVNMEA